MHIPIQAIFWEGKGNANCLMEKFWKRKFIANSYVTCIDKKTWQCRYLLRGLMAFIEYSFLKSFWKWYLKKIPQKGGNILNLFLNQAAIFSFFLFI